MKRISILLVLSLATTISVMGQAVKLSETPDQFIADVQKLMATGGPAAVKAGTNLQALWSENRLTPAQRDRLMALSRKMNAKRYQPAAHFAPLFETFYNAAYTQKPSAQPVNLDELLTLAEKQFTNGDAKAFGQVMNATRQFLERRLLYAGTYNKLYAEGGTFSFRYLDGPQAAGATDVAPASGTTVAPTASTAPASNFDGWDDPLPGDSTMTKPLGRVFIPQKRTMPALVGPVLTVKDVFLGMVANGDSVVIPGTGGDLMLNSGVFVGKGGKFDWTVAGRPDIFVTLADYTLSVMNPRLAADDVTLTHPASPKPIKGVFEYVSKKKGTPQAAQFPRFMSWQSDVTLPDLGKDVTYKGGFALAGARIVGASASGQPAVITVLDGGKPAFRVRSNRFEFTTTTGRATPADSSFNGGLLPGESLGGAPGKPTSLITAAAAQFSGYIETDSITHPSVQFRYDKEGRVAWLNRQERSPYARVPFTDTYHKFYIQPEVLRWDVARRKVDFYQIGAKREVPVRLESFDYFVPERYSDLSLDYGFHPLQIAANYISKNKTQTFLADDLAQFARLNPKTLGGALDRMVIEGYLDKDANTGLMRLSRKGILYVLAYNKQRDYDNFQIQSQFVSNDSVKNATINLNDKFLTVRGVKTFTISDSLKIYGAPTDKTLRIGKGRAFTLNGQLKSGTFRYSGRDMAFDYDKFAMNLNKIDSITFTPQQLAAQGRTEEVGGDIKYDKPGLVYLGTPDNKSGRMKDKKTTQRLVMPEGMTVYFNQPVRGNITYNEKVYFKIPAIDNDSLGKGDISFVGTFYSDGIFPPFKAELKTMPDNTLGFVHKAPPGGYPIYSSKPTSTPGASTPGASTPGGSNVKFTGDLRMDQSGLRAEGTLNHLTASLTTGGILFMTDSLLASGPKGEIKEGLSGKAPKQVYYPAVQLNDYSLKWWPKADSMVIMTQKGNFNFYNGSTKLEGNLVLRSSGLFGNGTLRRNDSEALSRSVKFNKDGFLAEDAQFKIISNVAQKGVANKPILLGTGLDVDFNQVKGVVGLTIKPTKNAAIDDTLSASMEFPYAAYKTNINRAQWNINAKTIAMKAGDVNTSTFTATGEEQEGLTFNAGAALYDVEKMTLNISGVPYVKSADARIYPDKGLVSVKRNGEMMAFKNARLELDTVSLHHKLKNGNIQILSRTRFTGDATYQFATAAGDTASIKMGSFELKEAPANAALASNQPTPGPKNRRKGTASTGLTYFTVARAEIDERDNLQLAPRMTFKGDILMQAPDKDLALDGFIKPSLKKRQDLISGWIPFKEKVVERIEIKVDKNLKNEGDQPLVAGIHYRGGEGGLYPTFLSPKEDPRDDDIFTVQGLMRYDEKDKVFRIVQKGADGLEDLENAFTFNDPKGTMTYKGRLTLMNTAPAEYLLASGSANINIDSTKYRLNTLLAFTFPVPEPITAEIGKKLVEANLEEQNDEPADDDLNALSDKMVPLIGQKEVDAYRAKAQNQHVSLALASPKLAVPLVFANVELRWSEKTNAFYSIGPLGVSNLGTTDINAMMNGFIEIRKTANGDEATVYVESSDEVWAFYEFKSRGNGGGQLAITTSDQAINDKLLAGSKNSAKSAVEIVSATPDEKDQFVSLYQSQYKTRVRPAPAPKPSTIATPAAKTPAAGSAAKPTEKAVATDAPGGKGTPTKPGVATPGVATKPGVAKPGVTTPGSTTATPADKAVVTKEPVTPKEKKKEKEEEKEGF
ncbi:hypothetical protein [Rudanella lutea]|uniref:hypothetical protein n=1 Tax=Rudanella lutea TaxID=451374 RepID=UPI000377CC58|nr:hypothetical protein [Rudanella lutea]